MFSPQQTSTAMELLPLLCLLLSCSAGTSADQNGPVIVKEESDAILPCSLSTMENIESALFDWKKKEKNKDVFLYNDKAFYGQGLSGQDQQFKGRVSHFPDELKYGNASIIIRNTKASDSGNYTCDFPDLQQSPVLIELVVGASPEPAIKILDETQDVALLQCEVRGAFPKPKVEWQDSAGKVLAAAKEPQVSERGGRFYITLQTTVNKSDNYSCVATQETIHHRTNADTYVHINGASAEPYVTTLKTNDGMLLQCDIRGASPKPTVEWQDSAGNKLPAEEPQVSERGGSFYIILQTTVTKTDNYRCVATQEEIKHQTDAEIYVQVNGFPVGWVVGAVVGTFFFTVIIVGGILALLYFKKQEKDSKKDKTVGLLKPPAGTPESS